MSRISLSAQRRSAVCGERNERVKERRWRTPSVSVRVDIAAAERSPPPHFTSSDWKSGTQVALMWHTWFTAVLSLGGPPATAQKSLRLTVEAPVFKCIYLRSCSGGRGGQIAPVLIERRWLLKVVMMRILVLRYFPSGGECLRFAVTSSRAYTTAGRPWRYGFP